jgi:hypothetical protein
MYRLAILKRHIRTTMMGMSTHVPRDEQLALCRNMKWTEVGNYTDKLCSPKVQHRVKNLGALVASFCESLFIVIPLKGLRLPR